eukprot:SM000224S07117  [mRNA]  locus=s224:191522:200561:- [translate_table: standard]
MLERNLDCKWNPPIPKEPACDEAWYIAFTLKSNLSMIRLTAGILVVIGMLFCPCMENSDDNNCQIPSPAFGLASLTCQVRRQRHQGELLGQAPQLDCSLQGRKEAAPAGKSQVTAVKEKPFYVGVDNFSIRVADSGIELRKDDGRAMFDALREQMLHGPDSSRHGSVQAKEGVHIFKGSFVGCSFKHCEEVDLSRHGVKNARRQVGTCEVTILLPTEYTGSGQMPLSRPHLAVAAPIDARPPKGPSPESHHLLPYASLLQLAERGRCPHHHAIHFRASLTVA